VILINTLRATNVTRWALFQDGSLLFYATTLTATSFGTFYRSVYGVETDAWVYLLAFGGLFLVLFPSIAVYVANFQAAQTRAVPAFNQRRFCDFCVYMAMSAVAYSLIFSFVAQFYLPNATHRAGQ
jgi:RsiW-degrading membrane proteinase PrsW (M82 family)